MRTDLSCNCCIVLVSGTGSIHDRLSTPNLQTSKRFGVWPDWRRETGRHLRLEHSRANAKQCDGVVKGLFAPVVFVCAPFMLSSPPSFNGLDDSVTVHPTPQAPSLEPFSLLARARAALVAGEEKCRRLEQRVMELEGNRRRREVHTKVSDGFSCDLGLQFPDFLLLSLSVFLCASSCACLGLWSPPLPPHR